MQSTTCCLIINHELNLDSRVTHVHVVTSADTDVYDLTEMIKMKHPANLVHVDADRLEVWKLNDLAIYKKKTTNQMEEVINRIEFSENNDAVELLDLAQNVMSLKLPKGGRLFVRVLPLPQQPPQQIPGITSFVLH